MSDDLRTERSLVIDAMINDSDLNRSRFMDLVKQFHVKYGIEMLEEPGLLPKEITDFRIKFLQEELDEYARAVKEGDLEGAFDALIDLEYVLLGTALLHGFEGIWMDGFAEVQRANMSKIRVANASESKRGSKYDVRKPEGWVGPNFDDLLP